jgi:hypothetical protein
MRPPLEIFEKSEKIKIQIITLICVISAISLLVLTILAIKKKKERLFFWTFLLGLTLFQKIPIIGLVNSNDGENGPDFIRPLLVAIFLLFLGGQIFSVNKLIKKRQ